MPPIKVINKKPHWNGFVEHGVIVTVKSDRQYTGICPWCFKDKFFFNPDTLLWDCKVCIEKGNFAQFLHLRMQEYRKNLTVEILLELSSNRKLKPQTLRAWGIGYDDRSKSYMLPEDGNLSRQVGDIQRYQLNRKGFATTGSSHQLLLPLRDLYDSKRVWLGEGFWDSCALSECLKACGIQEDVYGVPGAGTFPKELVGMLQNKEVIIPFDNDKAGRRGADRTGAILGGIAKSIKYLHWPKELNLPEGFDVRDLYTNRETSPIPDKDCAKVIQFILDNSKPICPLLPDDKKISVVTADQKKTVETSGVGLHHTAVTEAYRKWLYLPNSEVLDVLYGSVFANYINVDPFWLFLVAPPGGSKTELLMSLSDSDKIMSISSLTPHTLISGANFGGGDPSLLPKLNGKVLIVKDFTTIMNMNQTAREEIFGILRDAYDGKCEKPFGNGVFRRYESKFGLIAGVTPAIEGLNSMSSVLGERFVKYRIKQIGKLTTGTEVIMQALKNLTQESDMRLGLRKIAAEVLSREIKKEEIPTPSVELCERIILLAQLVAALRGAVSRDRYTGTVIYKPFQEIGTRLAKQFCAFALGLSVYRQETEITEQTFQVTIKIARDTCPDRVEEIVRQLFIFGEDYVSVPLLGERTHFPTQTLSTILQDLEMLHIVKKKPNERVTMWKLNPTVVRMIDRIGIYKADKEQSQKIQRRFTHVTL